MSNINENNKAVVKLQINTVDVLNRFIGEDPELKIQIKEALIQQFAKQYIKAAGDELQQEFKQTIKKELNDSCYAGMFVKQQNYHYPYALSEQLKEIIYKEVQEFLKDEVKQMINDAFGPLLQEARVRAGNAVDDIIDILSEKNIDNMVKRRLTKLMENLDDLSLNG